MSLREQLKSRGKRSMSAPLLPPGQGTSDGGYQWREYSTEIKTTPQAKQEMEMQLEHLPSMHEGLRSTPSSEEGKQTNKQTNKLGGGLWNHTNHKLYDCAQIT